MNDKRFTMCHKQNDINGWTMGIIDWETKEPFNYTTYEVHSSSITDTRDEMEDLCLLLNELNDENEKLKIFLKAVNEELDLANRDCDILEEDNEELKRQKERYKRLSEIREKEINNRILTIKEFIDNYSDDYGIKNVLLDLFHSEVKEYDLSKEYMALKKENKQLKQQIGNLEHTRDFCAECCERLEKESEELKFEIRKVQRAYEQLWEHTYK